MQAVLSIAGSDSSGGAGIQADIKTIAAHHLFAETAITALTAQNTLGVTGVLNASPEFVAQQIDAVFSDIRPAAVKIGMVSVPEIVEAIAERLQFWKAENVVVDPVMVATSGSSLAESGTVQALKTYLFPLADVLTPNIPEAEVLCGHALETEEARAQAALEIAKLCKGAVLVKGGHGTGTANDVLAHEGAVQWFRGKIIDTENTHGTGCTLSSAIACGLAEGKSIPEAVAMAKAYLTGALAAGLDLGKGSGPLHHMWSNSLRG